jgi:hypothetical protein
VRTAMSSGSSAVPASPHGYSGRLRGDHADRAGGCHPALQLPEHPGAIRDGGRIQDHDQVVGRAGQIGQRFALDVGHRESGCCGALFGRGGDGHRVAVDRVDPAAAADQVGGEFTRPEAMASAFVSSPAGTCATPASPPGAPAGPRPVAWADA